MYQYPYLLMNITDRNFVAKIFLFLICLACRAKETQLQGEPESFSNRLFSATRNEVMAGGGPRVKYGSITGLDRIAFMSKGSA